MGARRAGGGSQIRTIVGARQSGDRALTLFRHRADLGQPGQRSQPDDGPGRTGLLDRADTLAQDAAGLLQARIATALGAALSACRNARWVCAERAPDHDLRSKAEEVLSR